MADNTLNSGAAGQPRGARVPSQLAHLISPESQARRARAVQARLADVAQDRVFRRRSAELIAKHLIAAVSDT